MTTPYQPSPDGAFTIGGGEWNYGQTLTEALGKAAFELPMPTLENALDLLRMVLERLPLEALKPFQGFLDLSDELFGNVTDAVNAIIESLFEKPVWDALLNTLKLICEFITNNTLAQCIGDLAEDTGDSILNFVHGLFGLLGGLWDTVSTNSLVTCIAGMVEDTGNLLQNFVEGLLGLLGGFWQMLQDNPLAQCLVDWFEGLFGSAGNFLASFVAAVAYLLSELANFLTENPLINAFKDLVDDTGLLLLNVLNGASEALQQIFNLIGFANPADALVFLQSLVDNLWTLISGQAADSAKTLQDIAGLLFEWFRSIPVIGSLVSILTGKSAADGVSLDLTYLGTWARGLIHQNEPFSAAWITKLIAAIRASLVSIVPVSNISDTTENLLNQGSFDTSSSLAASSGWTWDTNSRVSGSVGSVKLDCATTSGTRQLYSNQNIQVAAGDRIGVSAFVNTSGYNGSSISIQLGIVTFAGKVQKSTVLLASRGGSNNTWTELTNRNSLWTVPKAANPADQITSVQVTIAVGNTATAGTVNWDDISLWKGGVLQQSLVEYLISMTQGLLGGLSTLPNGIPQALNVLDPWNYTLQAGADARQTANTGVTNAGIADDKVVSTNQALFGQDFFTPGTELKEELLPATVGAVGSGVILRRISPLVGAYGNLGNGSGTLPLSLYNSVSNSTADITVLKSGSTITGIRVENAGWYLCEVSFGLRASNTDNRRGTSALYNYNWNFAPCLFHGLNNNLNNIKIGADFMMVCWNDGSTTFGNAHGWSQRYAQSSFIIYLEANQWVSPGYDWNGPAGTDVLYSDGRGFADYFSISMLNRSLA